MAAERVGKKKAPSSPCASIIANLALKKQGYEVLSNSGVEHLTDLSRFVYEVANMTYPANQPFVGPSAFAHKGGLHVSAVEKDPRTYEHIDPALVGNRRHIVVSDQAGRSNVLARFREIGLDIDPKNPRLTRLIDEVKSREFDGYAYDGAEASFELLARHALGGVPEYYRLSGFRVIDERRWNARNELITLSEATVKLSVGDAPFMAVAEGNGPVNALDAALRKVLLPVYPQLRDLRLVDYKVRILSPHEATAAVTRVMIESADSHGERWSTVGVSTNVIDASYNALRDSIVYKLFRDGAIAAAA